MEEMEQIQPAYSLLKEIVTVTKRLYKKLESNDDTDLLISSTLTQETFKEIRLHYFCSYEESQLIKWKKMVSDYVDDLRLLPNTPVLAESLQHNPQ